uniref:Vacuolar protein sorting-associated protein 51 homolog n=1 Tax=Alexandrium monilatum TaxID=311494 RepID=A0A7S4PS00_9DINO|mmetsp:Transcript_48425/g.149706  ORF Transcript_48425/g.149706 Transcript_48425/m.149706 type:complete len:812 (-) Transcript_48425:94-2529(-)
MSDRSPSKPELGAASPAPEERRERRRVGALLTAYYGIEGAEQKSDQAASSSASAAPREPEAPLDREGFDAKKHFDSIVGTGLVADVLRHANEIDAEVRDLDGDMQMVVYENYSKFIRSMDVTNQMKGSLEGLEPDLKNLEGKFTRISEHQRRVEEGVSGRAGKIEALLRQQRVCKKLQVLFDLPMTLQRCLDQGAYGRAVQAYCCCAGFLRQHKDVQTLQSVLHDVEHQMGRIRSALEQRLRSAELAVEEAVNSAMTLLDLGQDGALVERDYLSGRAASLRASVEQCFASQPPAAAQAKVEPSEAPATNGDADPATVKLQGACSRAAERHVPELSAAVEGFRKLRAGREATAGALADDRALSNFVSARIHELLDRITGLVAAKCPPAHVLVSCINDVRESMRRLQALLPELLAGLLADFTSAVVSAAMKALSSETSSSLTASFVSLHEECRRLQEFNASNLDGLVDRAAKAEQSLAACCLTAVGSCQALVGLAGPDRATGQRLARGLQEMVLALLLTFSKVSWAYCGQEPKVDPELPVAVSVMPAQLQERIGKLKWVGFFGLALVWLGRRWEDKVMGKVSATARELVAGALVGAAGPELAPEQAVARATQAAAEAAMTHFVLVSGQRLAHFLRNALQNRDWLAAKAPEEPSLVVEEVIKDVNAFDAQLARVLGDPRKPRGSSHRRNFNVNKTSMELELERMMAKKLQAFAPVPFSRKGAVAGILRIAFKALYEYAREQTFAKFGLQQMQVDANLFAEFMRDFVDAEDANTLSSVLGEVVHSASQRCVEPVLMEERAVEVLCDKKKRSLRIE